MKSRSHRFTKMLSLCTFPILENISALHSLESRTTQLTTPWNSLFRHISMYPGKYLYSTNIINPPIAKITVQINRNPLHRILFSSTLGSEPNGVLVSAGCGKSDPSISIGIVCSFSASSNAPSKFLLTVVVCVFRWGNTSVPLGVSITLCCPTPAVNSMSRGEYLVRFIFAQISQKIHNKCRCTGNRNVTSHGLAQKYHKFGLSIHVH